MPVTAEYPSPAAIPVPASPAAFDSAMASGAPGDVPAELRRAQGSGTTADSFGTTGGNSRRDGRSEKSPSAAETADAIHTRLVALPTERLRQALASVETRQSLLALCGLPSATAEKVLASLPRRQARQVRRQLSDLGTIELREIDRAKAAVAIAADKLEHDPPGQAANVVSRQGSLMAA